MSNARASDVSRVQVEEASSPPIFCMNYSVDEESLHILHVDDDVSLLSVSKMILEAENKFEIDNVTSVDEAFDKLKTNAYDASSL